MQSTYAERFERNMGCTESEWLGWLPAAMGGCSWKLDHKTAQAEIGTGLFQLRWQVMPPRVIALMRMPVLRVNFEFHKLNAEDRYIFMKRFDLYMQRGGG